VRGRGPGAPGYPFHLGVTEAGDGEDGRIKSAIGIGALLEDGIGDTIRVSLTEDPVKEVPVARAIAARCEARWGRPVRSESPEAPFVDDPFAHRVRTTRPLEPTPELGGTNPVRVELSLGPLPREPGPIATRVAAALAALPELALEALSFGSFDHGDPDRVTAAARAFCEAGLDVPLAIRAEMSVAARFVGIADRVTAQAGALIEDWEIDEVAAAAKQAGTPLEWELRSRGDVVPLVDRVLDASARAGLESFAMSVDAERATHAARVLTARLRARGAADIPIVLRHRLDPREAERDQLLAAAIDLGAPLCDGLGDAIALEARPADAGRALDLAYRILQGARRRTTRTEFISCPSCGRTLFDLEETTARIKAKTGHLVGVKIAIMGCIVNGPGEMADADFGYVGSGPGVVNLYVGQECVERHVDSAEADERLVELIRRHDRWTDPQ
jgi:(E)-4-hydroxy-3-methylbut-2-enyl-diphosphate synthase